MPEFTRNGVTLNYEVSGPERGRPLLLIMGLGMQRVAWPKAFVEALVGHGFRVISFDNRDVGLSTRYDNHPVPGLGAMLAARVFGRGMALPYSLADLAADAFNLLDHLGIAAAHVLGISMGGMIAMHMAARNPKRVPSLTLMATSSGALGLPPPRASVMRVAMGRPAPNADSEAAVEYMVRMFTAIGSPAFPLDADAIRQRASRQALRAPRGTGLYRQMAAIAADGDRSNLVRQIKAPTLIIHGSVDPMVPPAHGRQLARLIPHARLEQIEGWGHDLPDALAPRFAALVDEVAR